MRILAIDTTTKFFCLALYDNGRVYEYNLELGTRHSDLLMPTIKRALAYLGWELRQIDYFACGLGPGSFTGARIGLAAIKGFAWGLQRPVVGISTLDILALNAQDFVRQSSLRSTKRRSNDDCRKGLIFPLIDAKRELIYCSAYRIGEAGLQRVLPYLLLSNNELLTKIKPQSTIFGDALIPHQKSLAGAVKGIRFLDKDFWYPQGRNIIPLALEKIRRRQFSNPFTIKPIYLYPKECQIR